MVMVRVRARNIASGSQPESVSDFDFKLTGSRNELYSSFSQRNTCGSIPDEIGANLFPGGQTEGNVCFKLPADETALLLVWQATRGDLTYFKLE
jgi:hypothetical protein